MQARIGEATDAIAQSFVESMSYDWRLYKVDVTGIIPAWHVHPAHFGRTPPRFFG